MSEVEKGDEHRERDLSVALRNAIRLGLSLTATWAVAIGVRFLLPRYLGRERFGQFSWAESTASLAFLSIGFGLDTYIQREVSTRPKHGNEFFGSVTLLRCVLATVLTFGVYSYVAHKEPDADLRLAALLLSVTQLLIMINASLAALLQASTKVSGLAIANVVTKIVWGAGVVLLVQVTQLFHILAVPLLLGEALKTVLLVRSARKEVDLKFRLLVCRFLSTRFRTPWATSSTLRCCVSWSWAPRRPSAKLGSTRRRKTSRRLRCCLLRWRAG
jgi:O-antigen/teichoic acid export membrane protein